MNPNEIKDIANDILKNRCAENECIEYKKSSEQLPKILKTLCAFGNNYYDRDFQYLFIGVDELNDDGAKAVPALPICGINEERLEKDKNAINSLRPYLFPNVSFEIIANEFEGKKYLLIFVPRQTGGPFMVSDKAEEKIKLKPGRYIRFEAESRLARVDEEYDLLRKFSNFHFSSVSTCGATIDDLSADCLSEYILKTSERGVMKTLSKSEMAKSLKLTDENGGKVRNFAILMFAEKPDDWIPYSYTELILDIYRTKTKMESKVFRGPIWKQYHNTVNYLNDNCLNVRTIRESGKAENRQIANFPFAAIEELVANAIVHNNYENAKPIQIYVSESQINIVNYNKPLPPLKISDLNQRRVFNERDTENPEIRDMFKDLGIIESFGTGIGEAKKAMADNGSPDLYYKEFDSASNVTSVVIPVNADYLKFQNETNPKKNLGIQPQTQDFKQKILGSGFSCATKQKLLKIYQNLGSVVFGNAEVAALLQCSETTATEHIKRLNETLGLLKPVKGKGKGKYRFPEDLAPQDS